MKKEIDVLDIYNRKGSINGQKAERFITIADCGAVVETDEVAFIKESYISRQQAVDEKLIDVVIFLRDNGLKLYSIKFKDGSVLNNCLMRADKPLKSFFDE